VLRDLAPRAGVLLDFDGSLSEIVAHPDLARPVEGAREVLEALVPRFRVVAIDGCSAVDRETPLDDLPFVVNGLTADEIAYSS